MMMCPKCAKTFSQVGRCPNKWRTPSGEAQCEGTLEELSKKDKIEQHLAWQEKWMKTGLTPFQEEA